jgi:hypothetical protein
MAAGSNVWGCGHSTAVIAGSNPVWKHRCLSTVSVVRRQVGVSATDRSLVRRVPTACGVSGRDRGTS